MVLTVQRAQGDENCTPGEFFIDGAHFCWSLEPRRDQTQGKPFCILAGTYKVVLAFSRHFDMVVPVLLNVPDFTGVEIHPGNFPKDTHGCTLVGFEESTDFVGQSDLAFQALMGKLQGQQGVTITYAETVEES